MCICKINIVELKCWTCPLQISRDCSYLRPRDGKWNPNLVLPWQTNLQGVKGPFLSGRASIICSLNPYNCHIIIVMPFHFLRTESVQFQWRPRPPSSLTPEKEKEIIGNLEIYRKKYKQDDQDALNQVSEHRRNRRKQLQGEWEGCYVESAARGGMTVQDGSEGC